MEVHFSPDVEKKFNDLAAQSGRGTDELLQDAFTAYFDELAQTRDMLDNRYDELKSGRAMPIDGEEAFARLKANTDLVGCRCNARTAQPPHHGRNSEG
jgi:hypothetical protein